MTSHQLLNNIDHKELRVITKRAAEYGDQVMFSPTFPDEFRSVQAHYPIFFYKDNATGQFQAAAMFGFSTGENLFLSDRGWDATYIPLGIVRQPFLIGFQEFQEDGVSKTQRVIHLDMDSPRISKTEGESLFLEYGGNSPYLEQVASALELMHQGFERAPTFIAALLEHELLESFSLDIELNDGSNHQLQGFYTINEDTLAKLGGDQLAALNEAGWLQPIYMAIASQSHIRDLIERKNLQMARET
ncbi:SapC family protein [Marinimicrobium alkaliphilum]|uniref:SapC family protein n=1 Tax=Marinimicrobium alkaliphilum TaxID=2202654 RepID=UPI000DB9E993|nr:SapC family protein [Marinimicrobium alkaliphilum]